MSGLSEQQEASILNGLRKLLPPGTSFILLARNDDYGGVNLISDVQTDQIPRILGEVRAAMQEHLERDREEG